MAQHRHLGWAGTIILAIFFCGLTPLFAADTYDVGQKVEVREGDVWSPATVLQHEGRRYQIHYDGADSSTDEWVTTDRMRLPGAATQPDNVPPAPAPVPAPAPAPAPGPAGPDNSAYQVGQTVEVKRLNMWKPAVVIRKYGKWTLINVTGTSNYEWVEPWKMRTVGSTLDPLGVVLPHISRNPNLPPPRTDPGPPPAQQGGDQQHPAINKTVGPNGAKILDPDRSAMQIVLPGDPAGDLVADAGVARTSSPVADISDSPQDSSLGGVFVSPTGNTALLVTFSGNGDQQTSTVEKVNLDKGADDGPQNLGTLIKVLDVSPDGKRMLTRSDKFGFDNNWRLDVWSIATQPMQCQFSFCPYPQGISNRPADIEWADFLDNDHVLTCSRGHEIVLWTLTANGATAVYSLMGDSDSRPCLSAGRKYVLLSLNSQIYLCDAMTGSCVSRVAMPDRVPDDQMALRADAKRIAAVSNRKLMVWDMESGQQTACIGLPKAVEDGPVSWVGDNLVLINGHWLFDVQNSVVVWEYDVPIYRAWTFAAGRLWYVAPGSEGQKRIFSSTAVPDPAAMQADANTGPADAIVKPGISVTLEMNANVPDPLHQRLIDQFTRELTDNGFTVADGQPTHVRINMDADKEITIHYHHFGFGPGGEDDIKVTPQIMKVEFVVGDQSVWEISQRTGVPPFFLNLKKDQTIDQAVADTTKPDYDWFLRAQLPKTILRPTDQASLGSTHLQGR